MKRFSLIIAFCSLFYASHSQIAKTYTSSEILQRIKKLKVLGSVLYIAAHPDDENTRLIAHLANAKQYRTGYLSLTRGDGGQNLIGDEQGIELGLIRTQELLAARRIDGGEQFFSRAIDFGFSKNPKETFQFWNEHDVLSDVTWVIRNFQPDVIIARFPEDSRAGHGQHSASGIMARLGYVAAASTDSFPEHFAKGAQVWQAKRMLWNTFNFGSANTIDSTQFTTESNEFLPLQGKSVGELAGESRSQHKSQGFGVSRQWGSASEYFTTVKGDKPITDLMDGVNTTWSRVKNTEGVEAAIDKIIANFNHSNPAASIADLWNLHSELGGHDLSEKWVHIKKAEIKKIIMDCAGIYIDATTTQPAIISGDTINIKLNVIARSNANCKITSVDFGDANEQVLASTKDINKKLVFNELLQTDLKAVYNRGIRETQPYWLNQPQTTGMFTVDSQKLIGLAENKPLAVRVRLYIENNLVEILQPIQYRKVDPVKAEQYNPVYISHEYLVFNDPAILLFKKNQNDSAVINVNITALKPEKANNSVVTVTSNMADYKKQFIQPALEWGAGDKKTVQLKIPNYLKGTDREIDVIETSFKPDGEDGKAEFSNARRVIEYDHIPTQTWHYQDKVKVLHIDLKTVGKKVGYITGAGDRVPASLTQMGYEVTLLKPADLVYTKLKEFDAIITGVRAYNIYEYLSSSYDALMEYVNKGGNLIVQYNTNSNIGPIKAKMSPYSMNIGRNRITDENAKVDFLLPKHAIFNYPNKITAKDFEGWVQERSIYHAEQLDPKFVTPIAMADPGEQPHNGALAIAPYGKGNFVYTGIVFFRELPAGVPGAYRLLANLIALPKN
jgi:LmbE family N-acetylglucosaminyl deacetylase